MPSQRAPAHSTLPSVLVRALPTQSQTESGSRFESLGVSYGILGFVRFTQGYYMLLITGRRSVGTIGGNFVYSVVKTAMYSLAASVNEPGAVASGLAVRASNIEEVSQWLSLSLRVYLSCVSLHLCSTRIRISFFLPLICCNTTSLRPSHTALQAALSIVRLHQGRFLLLFV